MPLSANAPPAKRLDVLDARLADWLARSALGDRAAFKNLYLATSSRLLGVIARLVGRNAAAEDILQEVYVRIWKAASQYRSDAGSPLAWMCATARYRAIDYLRSKPGRTEVAIGDMFGSTGAEDDPLHRVPDPAASPADLAEAGSDARAVQGCMNTLQPVQQQSIALAYYQGLSHAEIAQHLGTPLGSVKTWVRRGLLALRACLERYGLSGASA